MRWLILAAILVGGAARADDPRDAFGLPRQRVEPPVDCGDGTSFGCAAATDPLADAVPYALSSWLPASYLLSLPVADATHDAVAHYALGAGRDEAGPTLGGATGLENRWTIDGAPADNVRTGAADTRVPLMFLDGMLVTAGGFAARDRTSTGGTIDTRLRRGGDHHELEVRAWLGWAGTSREPPIALDTYQVRRGTADPGPSATAAVVATGPLGALLGGHAWYAVGLAPSLSTTHVTWTSARLVDRDGDGVPDGIPGLPELGPISTDHRTIYAWSVPAMARAGLDRGPHHIELTLIGSDNADTIYSYNSTLQASGVDRNTLVGDAIATWRGTWTDTRAKVQLAWHRSARSESAHDPAAADLPQLLSAYVPAMLADDPSIAAGCNDGAYPKIVECPVPIGWFASGGAGALVDTTADRPSITADVAHRIGNNVLRIGGTGEDARLVTTTRFTGGQQIRSLFDGEMAVRRFLDPSLPCSSDVTQPCPTSASSTLNYRTRYTAAYAEDTFRPAPELAVDGGLRWELMWVGTRLHFSNQLSPRLGASWDPLGHGRTRVWTSMGRSFALLPAGLGQAILGRDRTVDDVTFSGGHGRSIDTGTPFAVATGVTPIAEDELTLGGELGITRAVRATAWIQGRWLERGLALTPTAFDNPGRSGDLPATRDTVLFAAELATAPTARLVLRLGYMYGSTIGSWAGPFDPHQGATLYAGEDFLNTANLTGRLPTELGHRLYVEGERRARIGSVNLGIATRLTMQSGRPRNVLGDSDEGLVELLPRGSLGRGPLLTQANVRLATTWHGVDITLDLFDVLVRRDATNLDEVYTSGAVHPIVNGEPADLVFLRTDAGMPAAKRTSYDLPTAFQGPFSAVLGVRERF